MSINEKLNAIISYILAETEEEKEKAVSEMKNLKTEKVITKDVEEEIVTILCEIGMPEHIKGYKYSVNAIKSVIENPDMLEAVVGELYPAVAEKFNTTGSRVERAIRHAIEVAWERCDFKTTEKYFGSTVSALKGKPTNSEFIARIANIVQRRMRSA